MQTSLSTLIILALAVYRLSILVAQDDGPFDVFWRLRDSVKRRYGRQEVTVGKDGYRLRGFHGLPGAEHGTIDSWQFRGVSCPLCLSVWFGLAVALAWYLVPTITYYVAVPLALSGAACAIVGMSNHES